MSFLYFFLSFSSPASAWEAKTNSYGKTLHWNQVDIPFYYSSQGTQLSSQEIFDALQRSGETWSFADIKLYNAGEIAQADINPEDEMFSIVFQEEWEEDPEILALTYTWSNAEGEIVHFDIEVNTENFAWSTDGAAETHDLQNTITHEFGHVIGLDHSQVAAATMAPSSTIGEIFKRELHSDDKEGHQHIYSHPLEQQSSEDGSVSIGSGNTKKPSVNSAGYGLRAPLSACSTLQSPFSLFWIALVGIFRRIR